MTGNRYRGLNDCKCVGTGVTKYNQKISLYIVYCGQHEFTCNMAVSNKQIKLQNCNCNKNILHYNIIVDEIIYRYKEAADVM